MKKFGTFSGVFTPNVLTILGVIMYLRLGWVVGNAGFLGAVAIILLAKSITIFTGLSMSSMTTNIRIGAGGAYSIISKSLGLEAGGSIGIPFYIAQTLSAALYIIGFTESWMKIFPQHPYLVVAAIACYFDNQHFGSETEHEVMLTFARQAAVALVNAQLFDETRRRTLQLEALNAIISEVAAAADLDHLLGITLDHTLRALGLHIGGI